MSAAPIPPGDARGAATGFGPRPRSGRSPRRGHGRASHIAAIARDARLSQGYLLQIVLATAIAHLGLLMDSAPVIIGAMLISPLLGPIMGFGFAVAIFDGRLLRRSLQTLVVGTVLAIVVAALLTMLSPITEATPSLMARVRPSLFDLLVAIFGGLAGAYAILKRSSTSLVGVAIATALVPPLATVGWAAATGRYGEAGGALLLYVTNTAAIAGMATLVARVNGFGADLSPRQTWVQTTGILAALAVVTVPLFFSLSGIIREARANTVLRAQLVGFAGEAATVDSFAIDFARERPEAAAVVIAPAFIPALEKRFAKAVRDQLGAGATARVIQLRSGSAEAEAARQTAATEAAGRAALGREAQRLRASLAAAYQVDPRSILLDTERRVALVRLAVPATSSAGPDQSGSSPRPVDPAPLRAAFPDWTVETVPTQTGQPEAGTTPTGATPVVASPTTPP